MDDRKRESFFGSEGVPRPQRDKMKAITFSFGLLLLLVLASIYGKSALFDSVPFGGGSFPVLYLAFQFTGRVLE